MNLGWYSSRALPKIAIDREAVDVYFVANG